jgi:hypothetical protein
MATQTQAAAFYTIVGAHSGTVYEVGVPAERASWWAVTNGMADYGRGPEEQLRDLGVGEAWKSHPDARGVKITRIA